MKKRITAALCIILCIVSVMPTAVGVYAEGSDRTVIVGGALFGARMKTDGAMVVGIDKVTPMGEGAPSSPSYDAGMRQKDIIIEINGKRVSSSKTVTDEIEASEGKPVSLKIRRNGTEKQITITPIKSKDGKYKAGMWLRDEAAGIGTVTYIDPQTGEFAGLGHGICDGETGALLPIKRGTVSDAELIGVIKGQKGIPGELKGAIGSLKKGALIRNTESGVYGLFASIPCTMTEKMQTASKDEIKEGKALLRCSASGEIKDYEVEISRINRDNSTIKNFAITVTDNTLLQLTGGIVQGMSGSPIIQNGKLVGAVTHVTINDPTCGYGIFIENMLNAAQMPMQKAA